MLCIVGMFSVEKEPFRGVHSRQCGRFRGESGEVYMEKSWIQRVAKSFGQERGHIQWEAVYQGSGGKGGIFSVGYSALVGDQ